MFKVSRSLSPKIVNELIQLEYLMKKDKGISFKSPGFIQFLVVRKPYTSWAEDMGTGA